MKKYLIPLLTLLIFVAMGCQKELSFEQGNQQAKGSLQEAGGDCLPQTVNGAYIAGTALASTNTIQVTVNVTRPGRYEILTDTVNGYFFRGVGLFALPGANLATLIGNGTPFVARTDNFTVRFDTTVCNIAVDVLPAGTGPAVFTLVNGGTPPNCASAIVAGTYANGAALGASNYVDITVNVTTTGTYPAITATGGGMTFTKAAGAFTATGNQTLRLMGSGTPTTNGANTITFAAPFASCNFTVTVASQATFTANCGTATANGTYTAGTALTTTNTITIPVTVTTGGAYNVTASVNGMTFSGSGTLTTATTSITLNGSGTPTTATGSPFNLSVLSCNIPITVQPGTGGAAVFTVDCITASPDGLYEQGTQLNASNTVDITVNVTTPGTYTITTTAINGMTFTKSGTFASTGATTITLVGSGTPTAAGTFNVSVPGTPSCTFPLIVDAPLPAYTWQFNVTNAPATTYRGENDDVLLIPSPPPAPGVTFAIQGSNAIGSDLLIISLVDFSGTINNGETYSTSAIASNSAVFSYDLPAPLVDTYEANPTVTGAAITFTVTSHNTATKTITGTFSGTAKNSAGQTINITGGTFTGTYP